MFQPGLIYRHQGLLCIRESLGFYKWPEKQDRSLIIERPGLQILSATIYVTEHTIELSYLSPYILCIIMTECLIYIDTGSSFAVFPQKLLSKHTHWVIILILHLTSLAIFSKFPSLSPPSTAKLQLSPCVD